MNKYNLISGFRLQRIEAISDGVFAIALTFLALDIKVPISNLVHSEQELVNSFLQLAPKLLTYFLSFITLGIYWLAQSTQFHFIDKSDRNLNWINLFFLLAVSILSFSTAFLSQYISFKFAILIYWFNISLLGQLLGLNWFYSIKKKLVSIENDSLNTVTKSIKQRIIESQTLYTIAALLCFINTYISIGLLIVIQLNYAFAVISFNKNKTIKQ
ncbi:MAG: TMEM175 family protein [Bacteroidota bacterium]